MDETILSYYEQELTYVRELGAEFARQYPKIAGRLLLEPDKSEDPHTERLIEAFAFISSRVHKKIDDDFPEITQSLLNIIYPHYVTPIPSATIVQFDPIRENISEAGYTIEKQTDLFSKPVNGTPCRFSTTMPVDIWPVEVVHAAFADPEALKEGALQAIRIDLKTFNNISFSSIAWNKLRFFLNGQSHHVYHLYEYLLNRTCCIEIEYGEEGRRRQSLRLAPDSFKPAGFEAEESLLPYTSRSFPGYRLLFEYFSLPEKFLFVDLVGLDRLKLEKLPDQITIWIYLNVPLRSRLAVDRDTFCLHAAPAVNLFRRLAEPVRLDHRKNEYRVIADIRRQDATEIFSIDKVVSGMGGGNAKSVEFKPFYSIRHHLAEGDDTGRQVFWHGKRRPSGRKDDRGTEVYLSFADLDFRPTNPDVEILTLHVTCSNRDLPTRLPFGDRQGDFEVEIAAPVSSIRCLQKPTPSRRSRLGSALQWRLISHLALNYLSIVDDGVDALREILKLYDFDDSPSTRKQIEGIAAISAKHVTRRVGYSLCRGVRITMELDADKFVGAGLYLFASIMERFLGQYVSVNSFSQLVLKNSQTKETLVEWPPRSGNRILL